MNSNLNLERALIFRIVHVTNIPWILDKAGLYCRNSEEQDPAYVNIGNTDLIERRFHRKVPIPPGGTLADYVPFYFTPFSIMMYNIHTGYGGITKREYKDIVIFVSSVHRLNDLGLQFVFTNQHAYPVDTNFYSDVADLDRVDWDILQRRDFKTNDADPGKQQRYQAEALVHRHVPLDALLGVGCYNQIVGRDLMAQLDKCGAKLRVEITPGWYF
ncbi:MAG: DUF4433 domain-containing protein [Candidatus Hydrogenedentes bacterium]|nr:DUF4433 domain-containing protein [Candidatus Hydrogenedentota bacterium]